MTGDRASLIEATDVGLWGASLPKARQWRAWFEQTRPAFPADHGWQRLVYDALARLTDHLIVMGECMRRPSNSADRGRWQPSTWRPIQETARENLAWYAKHRPEDDPIPAWAELIFEALEGAFVGQVRLADECHTALEQGFVPIRITPDGVRPLTTQDRLAAEVG
jgi:hypothetical protein